MPKAMTKVVQIQIDDKILDAKHCNLCWEIKPLIEFNAGSSVGNRAPKCKICQREYDKQRRLNDASYNQKRLSDARKWKEKNKDRISEYNKYKYWVDPEYSRSRSRKYKEDNPDKARETTRRSKEKAKDRIKEYNKEYVAKNLDKFRFYVTRRNTLKRNLPLNTTIEETISIYGDRCILTNSENIQLDHFIPLSWGRGGTYLGNFYPLDSDLNNRKKARNPFVFFEQLIENGLIEKGKFDFLVSDLAQKNNMPVDEFRDYVFWCEQNKVR